MRLDPDEIEAIAGAVAGKLRTSAENGAIAPRLLSVDQSSKYLSCSAHSVRHLIKAGKLPVVKIDRRRSAIRNMERAAAPRKMAMEISGRNTESVYRRYDIVS